jgi:predicted CopG family antitoxin
MGQRRRWFLIPVKKVHAEQLKSLKQHPRETYDDVIVRLIEFYRQRNEGKK